MRTRLSVLLDPERDILAEDAVYRATNFSKFTQKLEMLRRLARENIEVAKENYKSAYDDGHTFTPFQVGSAVYVYNPVMKKGQKSKKLKNDLLDGPMYVEKVLANNTYILRNAGNSKKYKTPIHGSRLVSYHGHIRDPFTHKLATGLDLEDGNNNVEETDENMFQNSKSETNAVDAQSEEALVPQRSTSTDENDRNGMQKIIGLRVPIKL